jgi:hypothetical protein
MTTIASVPETRSFFDAAHDAIRAFVAELNAARAARTRRIALLSLLDMEPHRLDDMGIDLVAVRDALTRQ